MGYTRQLSEKQLENLEPLIERLDRIAEGQSLLLRIPSGKAALRNLLYSYWNLMGTKAEFKIRAEGSEHIRIHRIEAPRFELIEEQDPVEAFVVEHLLAVDSEEEAELALTKEFGSAEAVGGLTLWRRLMGKELKL